MIFEDAPRHGRRFRAFRTGHFFRYSLINKILRIRHIIVGDLKLFRIGFRCRAFRAVKLDFINILIISCLILFAKIIRENAPAKAENTGRDHNILSVITVLEQIVLQSSDPVRDHDYFAHSLRHLNDHILRFARDKSAGRSKIRISLIHLKGSDVHHTESFFSDMLHVRSDAHRLNKRIFFVPEPEHHILSESRITDRLEAVRKIKRGKGLAVEENHVLYTLQGFRQYRAFDKGTRKRSVGECFRSVLHLVFTAPRARILDQSLAVLGVKDPVHRLIVFIALAD